MYGLGHSVSSIWSLGQESLVKMKACKSWKSFKELGKLFLFGDKSIFYLVMDQQEAQNPTY